MSVLPLSPHPITGQYVWIAGPTQCEVAPAPQWILAQMQQPIQADSSASDRIFRERNMADRDLIHKPNAVDCDRIPNEQNIRVLNSLNLSEISWIENQ